MALLSLKLLFCLALPTFGVGSTLPSAFTFEQSFNETKFPVILSSNVAKYYNGTQKYNQIRLPENIPFYSNSTTFDFSKRNSEFNDIYDNTFNVNKNGDDEDNDDNYDDDDDMQNFTSAEENKKEENDEDDEDDEDDESVENENENENENEDLEDFDDEDQFTDSNPISTSNFDYRNQKINGVNLGGWLVTEPFISPSLYENASPDGSEARTPVDEYHFCKSLGETDAYTRLKKHWDTWITEADFQQIKNFGFNAVRLPIGYWAFAHLHDDPYVFGQEEYLEKSIKWCRKYGLKLWIDLHGIPGSQNGFDNSGQRDVYQWMDQQQNYDLGILVLQYIFRKYGGPEYSDVIIGYENLNEPLHNRYPIPRIVEFDQTTYKMLREKSDNWFVYHDAFLPSNFWTTAMNEPEYKNTVLDHHRYEVFDTTQLREDVNGHMTSVRLLVQEWLRLPKIQIVGEWSAALTDCCKWLNGVGRGARYDNTFAGNGVIGECRFSNDPSKMTDADKINTRRIIEAQLELFNQTNGFFFWTYKTESAIEWSMKDLAAHGLFPQPLSDRKFPKVAL